MTEFQEQALQYSIQMFGGVNYRDELGLLLNRFYRRSQNGWDQIAPVESPDLSNVDFTVNGLTQRKGALLSADLAAVLVAGDVLIAGTEFRTPTTNQRVEIIVSRKTIYTNQSGSWAQLNTSLGVAYLHAADVSKTSFAQVDNHLFIGLNGANYIQAYRTGSNLDPAMNAGNTYTDAFGGGTHVMTGTFGTGNYIVESLHDRLCFSSGDSLLRFTPRALAPSSGIWDLGGDTGGFYQAGGNLVAVKTFVPLFGNEMNETVYLFTTAGPEFATGFNPELDTLERLKGGGVPVNHSCVVAVRNWLVYLTEDKTIRAISGRADIDLGLRLKSRAQTSPLDRMDYSLSAVGAFGYYNPAKFQVAFWFTTSDGVFNDTAVVVDMFQGEPSPNDSIQEYEQRVRLLVWRIGTPGTNRWYSHIYHTLSGPIGITETGKTYFHETGRYDLGTLTVAPYWFTPVFISSDPAGETQWLAFHERFIPSGNYYVYTDLFVNRESSSRKTYAALQTNSPDSTYGTALYGTGTYAYSGLIKNDDESARYTESIQFKLYHNEPNRTFVLTGFRVDYLDGTTVWDR